MENPLLVCTLTVKMHVAVKNKVVDALTPAKVQNMTAGDRLSPGSEAMRTIDGLRSCESKLEPVAAFIQAMHDKDNMSAPYAKAAVDAVKRSNISVAHAVDEHLLARCAMMAFDKGDFETFAESMSYL